MIKLIPFNLFIVNILTFKIKTMFSFKQTIYTCND